MALNADALTDVATARSYIDDATADAGLLELLINSSSRSIAGLCERQFTPERTGPLASDPVAGDVAKIFDLDQGRFLSFRPLEARALTSAAVTAFGSSGPSAIANAVDFVARPRGRTSEGTFLWLDLLYGVPWIVGGYALEVTGLWGMAAPPPDVVEACLITVRAAWQNPGAEETREAGEISVDLPPGDEDLAIPGRALAKLGRYMRGPQGG